MAGWKTEAEGALRDLEKDRQAIDGIGAQILEKKADMVALTELGYGQPDAVEGVVPTKMKALLDETRVLEAKLAAKTAKVAQIDRVLAAMTKDQRDVLTTCYCEGITVAQAIIRLEREKNVSDSTLWRMKRQTLREFAHRMGWI